MMSFKMFPFLLFMYQHILPINLYTHSSSLLLPIMLHTVYIGEFATSKEFPWAVAIINLDSMAFVCSGSILSEELIIVSANHCVNENYNNLAVVIGHANLMAVENSYKVLKIHSHPKYSGGPFIQHDVVLLQVQKIEFNDHVTSIRLPSNDFKCPGEGDLASWGPFRFIPADNSWHGVLMKKRLKMIPLDECRVKYDDTPEANINDEKICYGGKGGGRPGESGGGLVAHTANGTPILMGIVSFTSCPGCSHAPVVFTRVSFYLNWLELIKKSTIINSAARMSQTEVLCKWLLIFRIFYFFCNF